jgi:hypothetical protein
MISGIFNWNSSSVITLRGDRNALRMCVMRAWYCATVLEDGRNTNIIGREWSVYFLDVTILGDGRNVLRYNFSVTILVDGRNTFLTV